MAKDVALIVVVAEALAVVEALGRLTVVLSAVNLPAMQVIGCLCHEPLSYYLFCRSDVVCCATRVIATAD